MIEAEIYFNEIMSVTNVSSDESLNELVDKVSESIATGKALNLHSHDDAIVVNPNEIKFVRLKNKC
ncbi:hypothetical protein VMHJH2_09555 [Streptococcus uberis]|uniref:hypothetical protein n=1 Tax=Streptococcus uberis TaxID=1349 RepID=UPI00215049E1|nr:hypothetical protein [Streptococcus uberis]MCR4258764.1 hypothetical protein [Streptococcus uberis]